MTVPLLAACDDPDLFGFPLFPRQRELLAAVEAGSRIHVWACGRRSGKSTMAALVGLHSCIFRDDLDAMVRPGELRYAVAVATNVQQAGLIIRAAWSIIEHSPLARYVTRRTEDVIEFQLPSGARTAFRAFPCSSRGGRGYPISTLIMDEAAHFLSETEGDATADVVWKALVPATAQFGDAARILVLSTPFGTAGFFADLYTQAASGELDGAVAQHAPTAEINPTITADFLAAEARRDPDAFEAEYNAQFVGSGGAFLSFDRFEIVERGEVAPEDGTHWIAGLDPAFSSDPFGCVLVGRDREDPRRLLIGPVRAWKPIGQLDDFGQQRAHVDDVLGQVIDVCRRYRATAVTDQYAAAAVIDRLTAGGVLAQLRPMSAASKTSIYVEVRARLYDGTLELRDEPDLIAELRRLRQKHTAGHAAVVNPRVGGSHGDRAQALALAVAEHARWGVPGTGEIRSGGGMLTGGLLTKEL